MRGVPYHPINILLIMDCKMSKFLKNMKSKLALSTFLCIAPTIAMENSSENLKCADAHMKKGWVALDRADCYQKRTKKGIDDLLQVAETEFKTALNHGSPYAAYALRYVYAPEYNTWTWEAKQVRPFWFLKQMFPELDLSSSAFRTCLSFYDQIKQATYRDILLKSIQLKNSKGIKKLLDEETELLINIEGGSFKNMVGLQRVEEINLGKAIACYGYLASTLENFESNDAFNALMRLQENSSTWWHIASAYFSRDELEEELNWIEKIVVQRGNYDSALELLRYRFENKALSLPIRVKAARLAYEYAQTNSKHVSVLFSTTLTYYKLLKEGKPQGDDVATLIGHVSSALREISENNFRKNPNYLFQFAKTQEVEAEKPGDWGPVLDMYCRAANQGDSSAREALINSPYFLKTMGRAGAIAFLAQHRKFQHLLNSYHQTNDPIFLVTLALINPKGELIQKANELLLTYHEKNYAPALDLKIHQLVKAYCSQYGHPQWLFSESYYFGGWHFDSLCKAVGFLNAKMVEREQENQKKIENISGNIYRRVMEAADERKRLKMEQQIINISTKKMGIIKALASKEQFELAHEYQLLNQATEKFGIFSDGYSLALEKSAEKGFLPAVAELIKNYTNSYSHSYSQKSESLSDEFLSQYQQEKITLKLAAYKEEIDFYKGIQKIITNEALDIVERADSLKKAFESKKMLRRNSFS